MKDDRKDQESISGRYLGKKYRGWGFSLKLYEKNSLNEINSMAAQRPYFVSESKL
jgi:hypothetical protein